MIGNARDGLAGQVAQNILWAAGKAASIDHPVFRNRVAQEGGKSWLLTEGWRAPERVSWGWHFLKRQQTCAEDA